MIDSTAKNRLSIPPCGGCCTKLIDFSVAIGRNQILNGINLHVHCGELTAIVGPNGAGKTTLLRAMLGEIPHGGEMHFVHSDGSSFGKPRIGYVPQKLDIDKTAPVSVLDLFAAANAKYPVWLGCGQKIREEALEKLRMVDAGKYLHMRASDLSCGQFQRVMLALALSHSPDLLLLDEPISGVDETGIEVFYTIVSKLRREYDLSILLISHDLAEVAKFADRMVLLNGKVLKDGKPADVLSSQEIRQVFGISYVAPAAGSVNGHGKVERHNCPTCKSCIVHEEKT